MAQVMAIVHYKRMHLVLESICRLTRPLFCMWPNLPQAQLNGAVGLENMRAVLGCFEVRGSWGQECQHVHEFFNRGPTDGLILRYTYVIICI